MKDILKQNVMSLSTRPGISLLPVLKKDGTSRPVVDYRQLTKKVSAGKVPISCSNEQIDVYWTTKQSFYYIRLKNGLLASDCR